MENVIRENNDFPDSIMKMMDLFTIHTMEENNFQSTLMPIPRIAPEEVV